MLLPKLKNNLHSVENLKWHKLNKTGCYDHTKHKQLDNAQKRKGSRKKGSGYIMVQSG